MLVLLSIVLSALVVGVNGDKKNKYPECCPFGIDACKTNSGSGNAKERAKLFPGLFVNVTFLELHNKSVANITNLKTFHNIDIAGNNMQRNTKRRKRATGCHCCQTEFVYIAATEVEYEGEIHDVVQYEDIGSYQFTTQGICQNAACSPNYTCQLMYRLEWILIKIDCPWEPDMMFVPVNVPSHCECISN
ncbi:uncharacterized protein LOC132544196 [Ylistrum balloti]|uniref:uncharacterized protein LOC132544196 n=1 Tax=Ylistrum balloti TaxID=509963 RepID=UPI002905D2AA|nr:uncharacterized protein LOC132544196 [Ylistrum balloti]